MRKVNFLLLLILVILLQACLAPTQIEETAIVNTRGVDLIEENQERMLETVIVPYIFDPVVQETTSLLTGRGKTLKEAREDAGKESSYLLSPGKITLELYGKEAAEQGILPFVSALVRDARVSEKMLLAVTNQTAREIIELTYEQITINKSEFFKDLINKETRQNKLPISELVNVDRYIEEPGIDPLLPIIDDVEGRPTLVGAAVFHDDRYVLEISLEDSFLVNQMRRNVSKTLLNASVPLENYRDHLIGEIPADTEELQISMHLSKGNGKLKIIDQDSLAFEAKIKMRLEVLETSIPLEINTKKISDQLKNDIESYYKQKYEELLTKLQDVKSDAFGIGRKYIATRKGSKTTGKEWDEKYRDVSVEFSVDVEIINTGAFG
ncbi:Ger(x)C family spore germination protein [Oceanobacillus luteolus]|uniref:Ger(X)C family spore germination protein n=1 Tax=Oceanobacillus luteolus TaxID=1274358 RepID=A0ABW4HR15_9BACI|nr:Ger(x)C family spore germination protein [Oceanobacillus luteolus]MCM3739611.1 Ger(x)C family spore germination protein [Oceanobacillus luteolus]